MRRISAAFSLTLLIVVVANADHPFDPKRYAFELFSEDEVALSKYGASAGEETVARMLEQSWAELDKAAEKAADLSPEKAMASIREAVRGRGGISERFEKQLEAVSATESGQKSRVERLKQASRHPLIWGGLVLFIAGLYFLNRRKS